MQFCKATVRDHLLAKGLEVLSLKYEKVKGVRNPNVILAETVPSGLHESARRVHRFVPADFGIEEDE